MPRAIGQNAHNPQFSGEVEDDAQGEIQPPRGIVGSQVAVRIDHLPQELSYRRRRLTEDIRLGNNYLARDQEVAEDVPLRAYPTDVPHISPAISRDLTASLSS